MSYLPLSDSGLRDWSRNFANQLGNLADPTIVGLTAQDVTDYSTAQTDYEAKYIAATEPSTRGTATILAKNQSREVLIPLSRSYAMTITNYQGVTDEQRSDFGLTIRDTDPTPVPPPAFAPEIDFVSSVVRTVKLRLHNEKVIERRGKPEGVVGATIFSYVGELPPPLDQIQMWKFEMNTSETVNDVTFPSTVAAGATVWFTATWYNRKGEQSPASPPENVNLPGTIQQAA